MLCSKLLLNSLCNARITIFSAEWEIRSVTVLCVPVAPQSSLELKSRPRILVRKIMILFWAKIIRNLLINTIRVVHSPSPKYRIWSDYLFYWTHIVIGTRCSCLHRYFYRDLRIKSQSTMTRSANNAFFSFRGSN